MSWASYPPLQHGQCYMPLTTRQASQATTIVADMRIKTTIQYARTIQSVVAYKYSAQ